MSSSEDGTVSIAFRQTVWARSEAISQALEAWPFSKVTAMEGPAKGTSAQGNPDESRWRRYPVPIGEAFGPVQHVSHRAALGAAEVATSDRGCAIKQRGEISRHGVQKVGGDSGDLRLIDMWVGPKRQDRVGQTRHVLRYISV